MKTEKISNKRDHAPKKTIVLVGIMGAGKSTVGKILADRLGMRFIDADQEIERAAGCTITDFFEKYGEVEFRKGRERFDHQEVVLFGILCRKREECF